ncbi:hypothetical protein D5278_05655 [bacterium 1XD21-13]|nr:hypothetical protein [bacterium 1XD21-13]
MENFDKNNMRHIIDQELKDVRMEDELKRRIWSNAIYQRPSRISNRMWKTAAAFAAILVLGGATVSAGYRLLNQIQVNGEVLPELDSMEIVEMNAPDAVEDENGLTDKDYRDYSELKQELGTKLLDSKLSQSTSYMQCHVHTDPDSFAIVTVDNFILGDTSNYRLMEDINRYSYDHGQIYYSPVSLKADLILGEQQMAIGWDTEYLGMSQFVEQYISKQGYRVNILEDTISETPPEDYVSKKTAIFVADGIRYSLTGQVSMETMKEIVDSMK